MIELINLSTRTLDHISLTTGSNSNSHITERILHQSQEVTVMTVVAGLFVTIHLPVTRTELLAAMPVAMHTSTDSIASPFIASDPQLRIRSRELGTTDSWLPGVAAIGGTLTIIITVLIIQWFRRSQSAIPTQQEIRRSSARPTSLPSVLDCGPIPDNFQESITPDASTRGKFTVPQAETIELPAPQIQLELEAQVVPNNAAYEESERLLQFRMMEQQSLQIQRLQQRLEDLENHFGLDGEDMTVTTDPPSYYTTALNT
ncbi:hypothetical protein AMATHDRAFT_49672 [Amanita thiersii Skay4041]|uniref:Uncharacterized protein n=1 Tax=Amanita thiersii Skay4041 TaxID=703135 RepID=A0A2A9NG21_9AGAR|nr:hypothetical protein AMATHDRAFT_49672 [Amanita thiersii Skay4041]